MEQIIDGPAVHEIGADQSGKNDRACDGFLSGLSKAQQQERYQVILSVCFTHRKNSSIAQRRR